MERENIMFGEYVDEKWYVLKPNIREESTFHRAPFLSNPCSEIQICFTLTPYQHNQNEGCFVSVELKLYKGEFEFLVEERRHRLDTGQEKACATFEDTAITKLSAEGDVYEIKFHASCDCLKSVEMKMCSAPSNETTNGLSRRVIENRCSSVARPSTNYDYLRSMGFVAPCVHPGRASFTTKELHQRLFVIRNAFTSNVLELELFNHKKRLIARPAHFYPTQLWRLAASRTIENVGDPSFRIYSPELRPFNNSYIMIVDSHRKSHIDGYLDEYIQAGTSEGAHLVRWNESVTVQNVVSKQLWLLEPPHHSLLLFIYGSNIKQLSSQRTSFPRLDRRPIASVFGNDSLVRFMASF